VSKAAPSPEPALAAGYVHCETLLREGDEDRWRASLFAPRAARPHLHALYAFGLEIARVREQVSDPMPGEIRHQWWRDAIGADAVPADAAHPVAAALLDTVARFSLPRSALLAVIEARGFDLYDDPMPTLADLEGYAGETSSAMMRLASLILAGGGDPGGAEACGHAGVAYALAGLMRALPWHARRGQLFLPKDVLDRHGVTRDDVVRGRGGPGLAGALAELRSEARARLRDHAALRPSLAPAVRVACAPAALVEPWMRALERRGVDPLRDVVDVPPIVKMWRLWRFAR
jgi:phytoene synthase